MTNLNALILHRLTYYESKEILISVYFIREKSGH